MDYAGDVDVTETWRRLSEDPNAVLIDVRTTAEWNFVGLPDLSPLEKQVLKSEWKSFPSMDLNTNFLAEVDQAGVAKDAAVFLICRGDDEMGWKAFLGAQPKSPTVTPTPPS